MFGKYFGRHKKVDDGLEAWKDGIEHDFKQWMDELTEIPEVKLPPDVPDIYSFYQELCVLRNEIRKGGRRNQDLLTRFGEGLSGFQQTLEEIQDGLCRKDNEKRGSGLEGNKPIFLPLVDILERMERLMERLESPPENEPSEERHASGWKARFIRFLKKGPPTTSDNLDNWVKAWNRLKEGFEITISHLDSLLKKEGVTRIETVGIDFDPALMTAVAVEYTEEHQEYLVLEEISSGFLFNNIVIKLAEVKISKKKESK
ncbi:MAG: nucleotide exchange factor GrpE [Candidatus Scalindua sp.]